jgi:hypothetical protein
MKNYKLVHEAKDHFVLHNTNDGKSFKMAKKAMSERNYQSIKSLPKFADGGEVEDDAAAAPGSDSQVSSERLEALNQLNPFAGASQYFYDDSKFDPAKAGSEASDLSGMGSTNYKGTPTASDEDQTPATPLVTDPNANTMQVSAPATGSMDPTSAAQAPANLPNPAGVDQITKGINEGAQAQTDLGNKLSKTYGTTADNLQKNMDHYQGQVDSLNQRSMDLFNAAQNDKIDPTHYWSGDADGKNAHSKNTAAIAMFLGGIGGAFTGKGGNVAVDQINHNIDRDIDAQKTNMANKHSLISQNLAITGSVQAAESMTQSQLLAITAAQVSQANAQAMGPEAVARKDQLLGQLKMQIQQVNAKTAMLMGQARIANGQGTQQDLNTADPKIQARAVKLPNGQVAIANSEKEAEDIRSNLSSTEDITAGLDRLDKLGPEAGVPGTPENKKAQSLVSSLKLKISNNEGIKRHSPELLEQIGKQFGDPSAMKSIFGANGANRTKALRQSLTDAQVAGFKHKLVNYQAPFKPSTAKKGFN